MKNKIVLASILAGVNLFALDINEAVQKALQNNYILKKQQYITEESKLGLDQSYGGYKPKVDLSYSYAKRDKLISNQIKDDSMATAALSYNLFNGFYDKYNIDSNKELFNSSKYTYEAVKQDLILEVKRGYIDYLLKQKNVQTYKEALNSYEKQYSDSLHYFEQGLIAQNELLEVEVQMLRSKQELQSAVSDEKIAKLSLEKIIGVKIDEELETISFKDGIELQSQRIENRSELKALKATIKAWESSKEALRSTYMPKIDASLSVNSYGDEVSPADRAGYPDTQTIGSVNLNWNIYNGQRDKLSILKLNKKIAQNRSALEDLKLELNLQYKNALEKLKLSKLNLKTAQKALESSKLNQKIVSKKLKEGISSNKDLIDANYLLTKAKEDYFEAYYNRYLNIADIERVLEINL